MASCSIDGTISGIWISELWSKGVDKTSGEEVSELCIEGCRAGTTGVRAWLWVCDAVSDIIKRFWRTEGVGDCGIGKGEHAVDGDGKLDILPSLEPLPGFANDS